MTPLLEDTIAEAIKSDIKNDEQLAKAAEQIAKQLVRSDSTLNVAEFVDKLGYALTSTTLNQRVNGTRLLSAVLSKLAPDCLNGEQLKFLSMFYADRLKDHHNVLPAVIDGIAALMVMKQLPCESVSQLLQSFFQHSSCQSQVRNDRAKLYKIFQHLSLTYAAELQGMRADFIYGLINSLDGERDPRNLDFIFTFMPNLLAHYPLLHLSEEMFEIFACYFPIDFNATPQDPDSITRDNLAAKLAQCLVAATDFVEWTVILALEKLDSDLLVAKLDSLELLHQAALKFPIASMAAHFDVIWQALKTEIFRGSTDHAALVQAALQAIRVLLEQAAIANPELSHSWQAIVLATILPHLSEPTQRLFEPAQAIALVCVAGDARYASGKLLNSFLITLQTHATPPAAHADICAKIYALLAQLYKLVALRCHNRLDIIDNVTVCDALQAHIISALRQPGEDDKPTPQSLDLQRAALAVLNECVPLVGEAQRALVYAVLVQLITHPTIELDFTQLLEQLGALHPVELQTHCIEACSQQFLPAAAASAFVRRKVYRNLLPLVKQLAFAQRVLDLVMTQLFQSDSAVHVESRLLALEAFNALLVGEEQRFVVELQQNGCLVERLIRLAREQCDSAVLAHIATALSHIVQQLEVAEQFAIVSEYLPLLQLQGTIAVSADLYVCQGLLGQLDKQIELDDHYARLLKDLSALALTDGAVEIQRVSCFLICSLVNKANPCAAYNEALAVLVDELKAALEVDEPISSQRSTKALTLFAWLTKGLLVSGSDRAAELIKTLAVLLTHTTHATQAVQAFKVLATAPPAELHLPNRRLLYQQKFFHLTSQLLACGLSAQSPYHLSAYVYVLQSTPHAVLNLHMDRVAPLLCTCLSQLQCADTLAISLEICERLVVQQQQQTISPQQTDYFRGQLQQIISCCLRLALFKQSMPVRLGALRLLRAITKYQTYILLPHKLDVVLSLAAALDDPKRLVRNTAVQARNAWYLVGTENA